MAQAELSAPRRFGILAICCMSLLIVGLDVTIVNVALPSIQHELHASVSGLQWTVAAYTLVVASLLIMSGSTADRVGRRRVFQAGLAIFTLGSLLCSLAPSLGALVAFRIVQGIGGSMLNPVAMSIITNTFTVPAERARAIGVWGGVIGLSMALGPVAGGVLVSSVGWRGIFWVNIPVGLAAILLTALFVPESRAPRRRRIDPAGQLLVTVLFGSLVYAIIEGPGAGWAAPQILACFGAAALAAAVLVPWEGLFLLPMAAATGACSLVSGRIVGARGARLPLILAGPAIALSGIGMTGLSAGTPAGWLIACYLLFGAGFGLVNAPITNTAVSGMPLAQAGVAAAVASTSRQVGQSLGVAVIGSVVVSALHGPIRTGFAAASHAGWWLVACCGCAVLAIGLISTGPWAVRTAERVAAEIGPGRQVMPGPA
jgi:MFS family permease